MNTMENKFYPRKKFQDSQDREYELITYPQDPQDLQEREI